MQNDAGEKRAAETMEGSILGGILRQFDGASLFKLFGEKINYVTCLDFSELKKLF